MNIYSMTPARAAAINASALKVVGRPLPLCAPWTDGTGKDDPTKCGTYDALADVIKVDVLDAICQDAEGVDWVTWLGSLTFEGTEDDPTRPDPNPGPLGKETAP